jgi:hypothetical protein
MDEILPPLTQFLRALGFESNPFQFTNADEEPKLSEYFIPPPYFASVYGDPAQPSSCMVFAPRGSGKSAQRRMVEIFAPGDDVLCVTYDRFRRQSEGSLLDMTIRDHEASIGRIAVIGLLTWTSDHRDALGRLTADEKMALRALALAVLSGVSQTELQRALGALRNLSTNAKRIWNDHNWILNSVLSSINIAMGGSGGTLAPAFEVEASGGATDEHLDLLGRLALKLGLSAIYVLIDRVDETSETTRDPASAYRMIAPLALELELLEQPAFAYKFFLPDAVLPMYQEAGGRSDRIRIYETKWSNTELGTMMVKRLDSYSGGSVRDLGHLLDTPADVSEKSVYASLCFAQNSPRDLIRIWGRAVDEQLRLNPEATRISRVALLTGIDTFCKERADEIATGAIVRDLTRIARVDFTVSEVASEIFRVDANSVRARVQGWQNRGVVKQIGEVPAARGRPHYQYGIVDVRVARASFPNLSLDQFLDRKARLCPNCESWVLRDWDDDAGERADICVECHIRLVTVA